MDVLGPAARSLLAEGRQLHVAVLATTGPHVTPELYTAHDDDIWFLTAADTLKTRVVRRDPRLSAVVRVGSRALVVQGVATDYDIGDPARLMSQAREAGKALAALTSFTMRNASDLGAFARDLAAGRLPSRLPPRRVLVRLRADASVVTDGVDIVEVGGAWADSPLPDGATAALDGAQDCVVAVEAPDGVIVAAGRCDDGIDSVDAIAAPLQLAGVAAGDDIRVGVVVDDYAAPGPAAKRGTLMRGAASLAFHDRVARLAVNAERETTWDGAATATRDASG